MLVPLVLLAMLLVDVDALRCYTSQQPFNETAKNLTDCEKVQYDLPVVSCFKSHDFNTNMITRGCQTISCKDPTSCHNVTGINPQLQCCCNEDACNSSHQLGISTVVSVVVLGWQIHECLL